MLRASAIYRNVVSFVNESWLLKSNKAIFKGVYFKAAWARYKEARPGTLRLMPRQQIIAPVREDYARMEPMFFGEPLPFEDILARLPELEQRINGSAR